MFTVVDKIFHNEQINLFIYFLIDRVKLLTEQNKTALMILYFLL